MYKFLKKLDLLAVIMAAATMLATSGVYARDTAAPVLKPVAPRTKSQKLKVYNYLLQEKGIDVVNLGDSHTIVIPSDPLFVTGSANFSNQYLKNLKIVAQLVNNYEPMQVAVNVYTSETGQVAKALTEKQAQKVMAYLQQQGLSTRLLYAKGYGSAYPVSVINRDSSFNRRIEIKVQSEPQQPRVY